MILVIPDVLDAGQIAEGRRILEAAEWIDGRDTAGHQGARVKHNQQLPLHSPAARKLGQVIHKALSQLPLFMSAALPAQVLPPMFNRYGVGQTFGSHVDGAIRVMGNGFSVRTDLSATLFFSAPDEYDGGELVIEDTFGPTRVKLPPGHMVLYPSTSVHHVTPVTRGERLCGILWMQSMVRDDSRRTLLFEMDRNIRQLAADVPDHLSVPALRRVYQNLLRQWSEI
jgi:PKHD-type hydroxylase